MKTNITRAAFLLSLMTVFGQSGRLLEFLQHSGEALHYWRKAMLFG